MSSPFDGIDRSIQPESLVGSKSSQPLTQERLIEAIELAIEAIKRSPPPPMTLLLAGLYEVVERYGWGQEALDWIAAHRMK